MRLDEQIKKFETMLFESMTADGFKKVRKGITIKNSVDCSYQLTLYKNKLRHENAATQTYILCHNFPQLNEIIYYLKREYFSSQWVTGRIWLAEIMPEEAKMGYEIPNVLKGKGYTHKITESTDVDKYVDEVYRMLHTYGYPFLERYNNIDNILIGLEENQHKLDKWAVMGSIMLKLSIYLFQNRPSDALCFAEQNYANPNDNPTVRSPITCDVFDRIKNLSWDKNGKIIVPAKPAGIVVRK